MISANLNNKSIIATNQLVRESDFRCPACNDHVILRAGQINIPHFAHTSNSTCTFGTGQGPLHLFLKQGLAISLARFGAVKEESVIGNRRTDLLWNNKIAFEVQVSAIDIDEIEERNKEYNNHNLKVVWVVAPDKIGELKLWIPNQNYYYIKCEHLIHLYKRRHWITELFDNHNAFIFMGDKTFVEPRFYYGEQKVYELDLLDKGWDENKIEWYRKKRPDLFKKELLVEEEIFGTKQLIKEILENG